MRILTVILAPYASVCEKLTQKLFEFDGRYKSLDAFNVKKCAPGYFDLVSELSSLPVPDATPRRKNLDEYVMKWLMKL